MLGDLLSDPQDRRIALLTLLGVLTLGVVLTAFGESVTSVAVLTVLGVALIAAAVALVAKAVVASHVHIRGTSHRLMELNDRYDATEQWLERFDGDARKAFAAAERLHNELAGRVETLQAATDRALAKAGSAADEIKAAKQELDQALHEVKQAGVAAGAEATEASRKHIDTLTKRLDSFEARSNASKEKADELAGRFDESLKRMKDESASALSKLQAGMDEKLRNAETASSSSASEAVAQIRTELVNELESRLAGMVDDGTATREAAKRDAADLLDAAKAEIAKRFEDASGQAEQIDTRLGHLRGDGYVQFARTLSPEAEQRLSDDGLARHPAELRYLERKLQVIEGLCEGRLAGSADDAVARAAVARAVKSDELRVLEIGVLFGVGAIFMHHALAPFFGRVHLTLLDPFDGYYGSEHLDPLTGQPVTRQAVERNLRRCGVPAEDAELVALFSTDDTALERVTQSGPYGVVIIDGDHSTDGIRQDFERYAGLVAEGGVLIVDDYGSPDWPDVTAYSDSVIAKDPRFERIAVVGKTAAYRRRPGGKGSAKKTNASAAGRSNAASSAAKRDDGAAETKKAGSSKPQAKAGGKQAKKPPVRPNSKPAAQLEPKPAAKEAGKASSKAKAKPAARRKGPAAKKTAARAPRGTKAE